MDGTEKRALEDVEKLTYRPRPSMMEKEAVHITLAPDGTLPALSGAANSLDGEWEMIEGGNADRVYAESWPGSIPAQVPGSVHGALIAAGILPDPTVGANDALAREKSFKIWWLRKRFDRPAGIGRVRLMFGGVCESCTVWLNGELLGSHKGMFGGPEFDVSGILQDHNTLIVKINPAPYRLRGDSGDLNDFFNTMNIGWTNTAVFNCVYGWHYANIPALGIWRPVMLAPIPAVEVLNPFVATVDAASGFMRLSVSLAGPEGGFSGKLTITVESVNFEGERYACETIVSSVSSRKELIYSFCIPQPRLWWPNGAGEQNLYRASVAFEHAGGASDCKSVQFGIRTIRMAPTGGVPDEAKYNWTFEVNGIPLFIKGANWCTIDFLMRFTRERYDRFLTLAQRQHIQILRAWGGGMPETDEFYDLCDRKGIMVMQEWPTAWDSQKVQDPDVLRDTVVRNTKRIRSHPSLALWTGGNESAAPTDAVMDMIGRLTYELDGTRVFHRNDPWGGSSHNYNVYWGKHDFDFNLSYKAEFIGEFGFASSPNLESAMRYLAKSDRDVWPPVKGGGVEKHTPVFNQKGDLDILNFYIPKFLPNTSLENYVTATQLSQVVTLRHTLELARTRWPEATGACYYKLTDVFPAVSWSTIDYYGVPKMAYYAVQDSFTPLHACILFNTLNPNGKAQELPVYLLDDFDKLKGTVWSVRVRAFDSGLREAVREEFFGRDSIDRIRRVGIIRLNEVAAASIPLFIVVEILSEGVSVDRTFYWLNYEARQGCLFKLPRAQLELEMADGGALIRNSSDFPAVSVRVDCSAISDSLYMEDNFFWLDAGERRFIALSRLDVAGVSAWNASLSLAITK